MHSEKSFARDSADGDRLNAFYSVEPANPRMSGASGGLSLYLVAIGIGVGSIAVAVFVFRSYDSTSEHASFPSDASSDLQVGASGETPNQSITASVVADAADSASTGPAPASALSTTPPSGPTIQELARQEIAQELSELGVEVDWRQYSFEELRDVRSRIRQSQAMAKSGVAADWRTHSLADLYGIERRAQKASDIGDLGYVVDWREFTADELDGLQKRAELANELKGLGYEFDWRKPTIPELRDFLVRATLAQRLREKGQVVDWRAFDMGQLARMLEATEQTAGVTSTERSTMPVSGDEGTPLATRRGSNPTTAFRSRSRAAYPPP